MKLADYVIDYLGDIGVKDIFVVYGAANGDLIDAFVRTDKTRYVCVMHEQAGGFAAEGYAKTTKNLGVAIATSGPGGHNFVTPIGNCFYDSVPCLFITGQINSKFLRKDEELRQVGFQETDIVGIVKPITKYAKMVTDPNMIRFYLEKAIHLAKSGRPGPVLLDIPLDIQKIDIGEPSDLPGYEPIKITYDVNQQIDFFIQDLENSVRPCIVVGGGVKFAQAEDVVRQLITQLKIPAFPTWNAVDVIANDFEYYGGRIGTYGGAGRNFGIQNADLILFLGSRLSGRITGGNVPSFARYAKKYVVDIDKSMLQPATQQLPFHENIFCDVKIFAETLLDEVIKTNIPNSCTAVDWNIWTKQVMDWKNKYDFVTEDMFKPNDIVHPYALLRLLSQLTNQEDVILGDCGGNIVAMNHAFQYKVGQTHITNNGNSPMGFSFAAGIGAAIASQQRKKSCNVIAIIGDGGFNMNIQELQTLLSYDIPLKTIILNNHIYGITKAYQEVNFEGRCEACGPVGYNPPDFRKIVDAYGVKLTTIDNGKDYNEIASTLVDFLHYPDACVLDINCDEHHSFFPKIIGWNTSIEDMYPYLDDEEFYSNMMIPALPRERFGE